MKREELAGIIAMKLLRRKNGRGSEQDTKSPLGQKLHPPPSAGTHSSSLRVWEAISAEDQHDKFAVEPSIIAPLP